MSGRMRWLVVGAMVLAACSSSEPAPGPSVDRLLVTGPDGSVTIVDGAGSTLEELTTGSGSAGPVQATSSPDGSAVVWTDGASVQLWSSGEVVTVEPEFVPFFYLWAPDGSQVLALGNDPLESAVRAALIDRVGEVRVVVIDRPIYAQWLNETELVMHLGSRHVAVTDGGEPSIFGGGSPNFLAPDVIDGEVVAVGQSTGTLTASAVEVPVQSTREAVVLVDPETGATRSLLDFSNAVSFAVSPDRQRIAILEGRRATGFLAGELSVIDVDGADVPIRVSDGPVLMYEWSPDGTRLLVLSADEDAQIRPEVWDGESLVAYPVFLPSPNLIIEYLPFWDQYDRSISFWAPDGSAFAYAAVEGDEAGIFVQPLDADAPNRVTDGVFVSWMQSG